MLSFITRKLQAPVLQALQHIKEIIVSQLDTIEAQISTLTTKLSNLEALTVELHAELLALRNTTAEADTAQRLNVLIHKLAQANDSIDNTLAVATEHAGNAVGTSSAAVITHEAAVQSTVVGNLGGGGSIGEASSEVNTTQGAETSNAQHDAGQDAGLSVQTTTASEQQATAAEAAATETATTESTGTETGTETSATAQ